MTFWSVFLAVALSQLVVSGILFGVGFCIGRLKKRRRVEHEMKELASFRTPPITTTAEAGQEYHGHPLPEHGLEPCPFCGSLELTIARYDTRPGGPPWTEFAVTCMTCGANGPTRREPEAAGETWNAPRNSTKL